MCNKSDSPNHQQLVPPYNPSHLPDRQPHLSAEMHPPKLQIPRISTCSRLLLPLPASAQEVVVLVLVLLLEGLEILISFATIHSSSSSVKLFSSSHKCSSRFYNR